MAVQNCAGAVQQGRLAALGLDNIGVKKHLVVVKKECSDRAHGVGKSTCHETLCEATTPPTRQGGGNRKQRGLSGLLSCAGMLCSTQRCTCVAAVALRPYAITSTLSKHDGSKVGWRVGPLASIVVWKSVV